ncbi:AMP-binding protein [bacterium]|nr:AMP-binding protein [bacterium]
MLTSNQNLVQFLLEAERDFPRRAAVWSERGPLSYQQLVQEVRAMAGLLQAWGVQPGDRVFLLLPNWPQFVIACQAIWWVGGVAALSSPLIPPQLLIEQLRKARPKVVITSNRLDSTLAHSIRNLGVDQIILSSGREYLRSDVGWLFRRPKPKEAMPGGVHRWRACMREARASEAPFQEGGARPAALIFSGETTGNPKGVVLSHQAIWANTLQLEHWDTSMQRGKERMLAALPLAHAYGLTGVMCLGMRAAGTLILSSSLQPDHLADLTSRFKPSLFPGTPALYAALLNLPNLRSYKFSSIRLCACGSAALPLEVQEGFERVTRARVVEGYGLTEAGPITHVGPLEGERRQGSVGLPLLETESRILHLDTGQPQPPGEIGELVVRGPQLMSGYWEEPQATAAALRDGWLHTGDLGVTDSDGYTYLLGRMSDCCKVGDNLVYPRRIEEVVHLHPSVQEVAVLGWPAGFPRDLQGIGLVDKLHAFVVPRPGKKISVDELRQYVEVRLPEWLRPELWTLLPQLPRTPFGKVSRISLYGAL